MFYWNVFVFFNNCFKLISYNLSLLIFSVCLFSYVLQLSVVLLTVSNGYLTLPLCSAISCWEIFLLDLFTQQLWVDDYL